MLSKVFESIVNQQLVNYLEKHNLLSGSQFGFRRGLGTSDLLTALHHQWVSTIGTGGTVRVLAIDIAGAFDRVSHRGLLVKLRSYGIHSKLLEWLESYLSNRSLEVVVEGQTSSRYPITAGVPQGSILGPTLFLLFINDMEDHVPSGVELAIYADDTTLYCQIASVDEVEKVNQTLQTAVDAIQEWGDAWSITFEPSKSQSMNITNKRDHWALLPIKFGKSTVPEDQAVKLLGVTFDCKLTFRAHIRHLAVRANQRLVFLRRASRLLDKAGTLSVYKGFVRPLLEYSPLVWMGAATSHLKQLDRVQHRAIRTIANNAILQSLRLRRTVAGICYLYKLQCLPGPNLVTRMVPPRASPIDEPRTRRQTSNRHPWQLCNQLPAASTDLLKRSFPYGIIDQWNAIPAEVLRTQPVLKGLPAFKRAVYEHLSKEHWAWDFGMPP